jgi:hypothetical protein
MQESAFEALFRLVGVPCGKVSLRLEWKASATGASAILQRPPLSSENIPSSHGFLQLLTEFPHCFDCVPPPTTASRRKISWDRGSGPAVSNQEDRIDQPLTIKYTVWASTWFRLEGNHTFQQKNIFSNIGLRMCRYYCKANIAKVQLQRINEQNFCKLSQITTLPSEHMN